MLTAIRPIQKLKGETIMDFRLSEEQQLFKTSVNNFLSKNYQTDVLRKMLKGEMEFPSELWEKISELGWLGVAIPEDYRGSGMGFQELVILFEEMGSACLISPVLSTVLSSLLILDAGNKKQKENFLPKSAGGELIFALALHEPGFYYQEGGIQVKASKVNDDFVLDGIKAPVPSGGIADYFICLANTGDRKTTLFIVKADTPGITLSPLKTIAGDSQVEIRFDQVAVSLENVLGETNRGWALCGENNFKSSAFKKCRDAGRVTKNPGDVCGVYESAGTVRADPGQFPGGSAQMCGDAYLCRSFQRYCLQAGLDDRSGDGLRPGYRHGQGLDQRCLSEGGPNFLPVVRGDGFLRRT